MYDIKLLAILNDRKNYDMYSKYIGSYHLKQETKQILDDIVKYYIKNDVDSFDWEDFRSYLHIDRHPTWETIKHEMFDAILDQIIKETGDVTIVNRLNELVIADRLTELVQGVKDSSDTANIEEIEDILEEYRAATKEDKSFFVDMDIENLVASVIKGAGITWRLNDLNYSVGQIHQSDFILVAKRPETGGTTFLTSEFTYMLDQLPEGKSAIIFNNEEGGEKIGLRVVQSALDVDTATIEGDPDDIKARYTKFLNGRKLYVYDEPGMTIYDIKRVLRNNPDCWLIGLNILDKIGGYNKMDDTSRFRKLAESARNLAKEHGAVIAIAQADGSAEGQQYLDQTQLYGSKTGVQGEADVMIMIGKDDDPTLRYFSIAKNKKPTTGDMKPMHRHVKFKCDFDENKGRFVTRGDTT
jgi:replicative DNA helicase